MIVKCSRIGMPDLRLDDAKPNAQPFFDEVF
jgi:hypothetical protein